MIFMLAQAGIFSDTQITFYTFYCGHMTLKISSVTQNTRDEHRRGIILKVVGIHWLLQVLFFVQLRCYQVFRL